MSPSSAMTGVDLSSPSFPRNDSTGPFSLRKKTSASIHAVRSWLSVNSSGQSRLVQSGKRAIMMRTGLSARDLRILDPNLSHPFAVLGRDRAIVINLEQIKAVVTATEALVLNYSDPTVSPFLLRLQRRLSSRPDPEMEGDGNTNDDRNAYDLEDMKLSRSPPNNYGSADYTEECESNGKCQVQVDEKGKSKMAGDLVNSHSFKFLPFEFIVLEACLETACSCLEIEATTLENEAYPALDKLTTKISTLNLEHVRQIKSRLVAITGRVSKVRDELEHLLDDDDDMAEMYLTDKLLQQQSNGSSQCSHMNKVCSYKGKRVFANGSLGEYSVQNQCDNNLRDAFSSRSSSKQHHVEELEMLLEAYFVQIDSTLNKLSSLGEYVVDTENYINIMLDDKRNHLLQAGVVLMTATLIVSAFVILAAIFGMNIAVDLFDENKSGTAEFVWTVGGGATGSLLLYVVAVSWCKHRGLLE